MNRNTRKYFLLYLFLMTLLLTGFYPCQSQAEDALDAPETYQNLLSIPINGFSDTNELNWRIVGPAIYAARLSKALECHAQNCEVQIIKILDEYYTSEFDDFYSMVARNDSKDLRLDEEIVMKLKSMRLLEQFLRQSDYEKAADRLNSMFKGQFVSHSNKSLVQFLEDLENPDDKRVLLEAFSPDNMEVQKAIENSCGIHQQNFDSMTRKKQISQAASNQPVLKREDQEAQNKKLCGILTSEVVLGSFARGAAFYASNNTDDSSSEYQCRGVRLAIDRHEIPWRPDPDRPKLLYVIYQDKTIYRLNEGDLMALQNEVERYILAQKKIKVKLDRDVKKGTNANIKEIRQNMGSQQKPKGAPKNGDQSAQ
jgi:hypothetical protein